jgi:cell division protein FtsQ
VTDQPLHPVAPHPRIRQRRVEVRRDEGRRRLRVLLIITGTFAMLGVGYGVTRSPLLDVDRVHVRGATHTSVDEVVVATGLGAAPAMLDVDDTNVGRTVEDLPWVESATVTRRWPGTVEITLLERSPLAALPAGPEVWAVVDLSGRVLELRAGDPGDLVRVAAGTTPGAPGSRVDASTRGALRLVAALPEALATRVPSLAVGANGAIELQLDGKIPVHVGAPRQLGPKLVALTTLVQKADLRRVRTIDVRVPTAPVLTRG